MFRECIGLWRQLEDRFSRAAHPQAQGQLCRPYGAHSVHDSSLKEMENLADIIRDFKRENISEHSTLTVVARRRRILHSAITALNKGYFDWHKRPQIEFVGEMADDYGGPTREFFSFVEDHDLGIHKSTVKKFVYLLCKGMIQSPIKQLIKVPNEEEALELVRRFEAISRIPQIMGLIDGTHIPVLPPTDGYRDCVNRKGWPSYVLQGVVDDKGCCKMPGSAHDATVLHHQKAHLLPKGVKNIEGEEVRLLVVGDPAYPSVDWLIKGYTNSPNVTPEQESFNVYLSSLRSESSTDRIYEFSAVTLLDDRQIDSYSSTDGVRAPKQDWLKEMKESEWTAGTDKLKYDGHWLNKSLDNQMKAFTSKSGGHTLQRTIGCEVETDSGGSLSVLNCINEYGYDGQNLISYNWTSRRWSASVSQAKVLEEEWNAGPVDRRCEDCVEWLKIYLCYNTTDTKLTPPDVHVFAKKSVTESKKLKLTCLATSFYPKDVEIKVRKFHTSLPEHLLTSSGLRPIDDGTYQLRKSVEIQEDEAADYDCYVTHSSLNTPVIKQWERKSDSSPIVIGTVIGGVALLVVLIFHINKRIN
ncbi:hypothetical protein SRHO_G00101110, partial [Serrasalmus rhombeus]